MNILVIDNVPFCCSVVVGILGIGISEVKFADELMAFGMEKSILLSDFERPLYECSRANVVVAGVGCAAASLCSDMIPVPLDAALSLEGLAGVLLYIFEEEKELKSLS